MRLTCVCALDMFTATRALLAARFDIRVYLMLDLGYKFVGCGWRKLDPNTACIYTCTSFSNLFLLRSVPCFRRWFWRTSTPRTCTGPYDVLPSRGVVKCGYVLAAYLPFCTLLCAVCLSPYMLCKLHAHLTRPMSLQYAKPPTKTHSSLNTFNTKPPA